MRLSNRLLWQGYAKERLRSSLRKFYGRYGDLIKPYEVPSPECYTTIWMMTIYSESLRWSGMTQIFDPVTDFDLITEFDFFNLIARGFHTTFATGSSMPTEDAFSSGHLVLSHFGTCKCTNVETNLSSTCLLSGLLSFEHPSVLLICFKH